MSNAVNVASTGSTLLADASGNLGLGVTPSAWGSAFKAAQIGVGASLAGRTANYTQFYLMANSYYDGSNFRYLSSAPASYYHNDAGAHYWFNAASGTAGNAISFTQAMTLDANGSLLVGGTTVVTNNGGITATTTSSGSVAVSLAMRNAGTANGSGTRLAFRGVTNTGAEADYAYLSMVADDTTAKTGSIRFSTVAGGSPVERARIDSSGNLLVGTTSGPSNARFRAYGNASADFNFGPQTGTGNDAFIVYNQSNVGVYLVSGNTSWTGTSDERKKDIIEPIADAANKVASLRAVIGKFKTDEEGTRRSFLIAQDVQAVLPEAVSIGKDEDATLGIQYTEVIPLLVAAIKEQQAIITSLTERITALEGAA